jgi:hypothetical protein
MCLMEEKQQSLLRFEKSMSWKLCYLPIFYLDTLYWSIIYVDNQILYMSGEQAAL